MSELASLSGSPKAFASLSPSPRASDIFFGIDGTGADTKEEYDRNFRDSFVKRIYNIWASTAQTGSKADYQEGPTLFNYDRSAIYDAKRGYEFVLKNFLSMTWPADKIIQRLMGIGSSAIFWDDGFSSLSKTSPNMTTEITQSDRMTLAATVYPRVFLAGYSRGGAAVVYLSNMLKKRNIDVYCLMLFDAVRRSVETSDVDEVPENVRLCYHAMRNPNTNSRWIFGNCATTAASKRTIFIHSDKFFCTHGGMGGLPWSNDKDLKLSDSTPPHIIETNSLTTTNVTLSEDNQGSSLVGTWMQRYLEAALKQPPSPYLDMTAAERMDRNSTGMDAFRVRR